MSSRYVIDHLPPFTQPERVQLKLYSGGHMFYVADEPRKSFTADMKAFYGRRQRLDSKAHFRPDAARSPPAAANYGGADLTGRSSRSALLRHIDGSPPVTRRGGGQITPSDCAAARLLIEFAAGRARVSGGSNLRFAPLSASRPYRVIPAAAKRASKPARPARRATHPGPARAQHNARPKPPQPRCGNASSHSFRVACHVFIPIQPALSALVPHYRTEVGELSRRHGV